MIIKTGKMVLKNIDARAVGSARGSIRNTFAVVLLFVLSLSVIGLAGVADASAQTLPVLTDRVVDDANVLSASEKASLIAKLSSFEQRSSDQIVVATVNGLNGMDIETYANQLFRHWEIGQKNENNGILLLVAPAERKVRIEVGYGLEGTMTDALSAIIIQNGIIPQFREGNFAQGILNGVDDIIQVLNGEAAELEARAKRNQEAAALDTDWVEVIVIAFWVFMIVGGFGFAVLAPIFGRKIGPGRYVWLGITIDMIAGSSGGSSGGGFGGGGRSSGGGFSGGGGSSGGGGASGSW